jgi:hypothetical protein
MAENWHIRIEDSEITFINKLLTGPDVEAKVESDVKNFLLSIGVERADRDRHLLITYTVFYRA